MREEKRKKIVVFLYVECFESREVENLKILHKHNCAFPMSKCYNVGAVLTTPIYFLPYVSGIDSSYRKQNSLVYKHTKKNAQPNHLFLICYKPNLPQQA